MKATVAVMKFGGGKMGLGMRKFKFWGSYWLECLGISAGAALIMIFMYGIGSSDPGHGGIGNMFMEELALYPYYLVITGAFIILIVTINYYQLYFSILVSMNCTRKQAAGEVLLATTATILGIAALAAALWLFLPGDIAADGIKILPLLAGLLFIDAALAVVMGIVTVRWGKIGMIIMVLVCTLAGGLAGAWTVLGDARLFDLIGNLQFNFYAVLGIGIGLYLAAGVFSVAATRKLEVRI